MSNIEFKIPRDRAVMLAMADYLRAEAGAPPSTTEEPDSVDKAVQEIADTVGDPSGGTDPAQGASAPASTDGAVEVDKNGLPWDARIHSDAKEKLSAKGYWKKRRGVDDATVQAVEAELRQLMVANAAAGATEEQSSDDDAEPSATPPQVAAPAAPAAPTEWDGSPRLQADGVTWEALDGGSGKLIISTDGRQTWAFAPEAPAAAPAPTVAPTNGGDFPACPADFAGLCQVIADLGAKYPGLDQHTNAALAENNVPQMASLASAPNLIQPFYDSLIAKLTLANGG